jgi:hypothetical protein
MRFISGVAQKRLPPFAFLHAPRAQIKPAGRHFLLNNGARESCKLMAEQITPDDCFKLEQWRAISPVQLF